MLFTSLGRSVLGKTVPSVLESHSACGLGRYPRPRALRTSRPVNNIYFFKPFFTVFSIRDMTVTFLNVFSRVHKPNERKSKEINFNSRKDYIFSSASVEM